MSENKKVKLNVIGLSYSQTQSGAYALILAAEDSEHRIPIIIGSYEAQAIAIELEALKPPRPLTHDLFVTFANSYGINLLEVNIYRLDEGVFFSELVFDNAYEKIHIDSRTSDAVALALRFKCPIYTSLDILNRAGIILNIDKEPIKKQESKENIQVSDELDTPSKKANYLTSLSVDELEAMLNQCVEDEDYEKASEIRDEINKRKK